MYDQNYERKEWESNPQGSVSARPASNRFPSPIGWSLRSIWLLFVDRSADTFRRPPVRMFFKWTHRELNPDFQSAELASSRWTISPFCQERDFGMKNVPCSDLAPVSSLRSTVSQVDLMGVEPTTPTLQGSVAPNGMQAQLVAYLSSARSYCAIVLPDRGTLRGGEMTNDEWPFVILISTFVIHEARGLHEKSCPLTTPKVTEVGVEPTGTRPSIWPLCLFAYLAAM